MNRVVVEVSSLRAKTEKDATRLVFEALQFYDEYRHCKPLLNTELYDSPKGTYWLTRVKSLAKHLRSIRTSVAMSKPLGETLEHIMNLHGQIYAALESMRQVFDQIKKEE